MPSKAPEIRPLLFPKSLKNRTLNDRDQFTSGGYVGEKWSQQTGQTSLMGRIEEENTLTKWQEDSAEEESNN